GLGLPVLKTVAVPPQLLPEPTAMAAVKLLCAPRLEHYMVLGPVLGQVADTGTTFTNTLEVFMEKQTESNRPNNNGPVLGQVVTLLPCNTPSLIRLEDWDISVYVTCAAIYRRQYVSTQQENNVDM
ncbi:hypothetical protein J6590_101368, partial [Homalodisca vitripennis]